MQNWQFYTHKKKRRKKSLDFFWKGVFLQTVPCISGILGFLNIYILQLQYVLRAVFHVNTPSASNAAVIWVMRECTFIFAPFDYMYVQYVLLGTIGFDPSKLLTETNTTVLTGWTFFYFFIWLHMTDSSTISYACVNWTYHRHIL